MAEQPHVEPRGQHRSVPLASATCLMTYLVQLAASIAASAGPLRSIALPIRQQIHAQGTHPFLRSYLTSQAGFASPPYFPLTRPFFCQPTTIFYLSLIEVLILPLLS